MQANPDGYFYADPDGNIIEPGAQNRAPSGDAALPGGEQGIAVPDGPPAAGDDFLNRATGRQSDPARTRPKPAATPKPN